MKNQRNMLMDISGCGCSNVDESLNYGHGRQFSKLIAIRLQNQNIKKDDKIPASSWT